MRDIITFITGAAGLLFATNAPAQQRAPFTGPHIDAVIGFDRVQGNDAGDDGVTFGGGLGWDLALAPSLRAGLELEATGSTQKECATGAVVAGDRLCTRAGRDLYVGGRIGVLAGQATMIYAKAGYSNAAIRTRYTGTGAAESFSANDKLDGVRLGAGVEHMLGSKLSVKAEYRYSNYRDGAERHQVVAGFAYRF